MVRRHKPKLTIQEKAELTGLIGHQPQVIVVSTTANGKVAVLADYLAISDPRGWLAIRWIDIQRGGWDEPNHRLYWELVDHSRGEVELCEGFQSPVAFAERIRASIVLQRSVRLSDNRSSVLIIGRRQPGSNDPIVWQVEAMGECQLSDPDVQNQILQIVEEAKSEFV